MSIHVEEITLSKPEHLRRLKEHRCENIVNHSGAGLVKRQSRCNRFATYKVNEEKFCTQHAGAKCLAIHLNLVAKTPYVFSKGDDYSCSHDSLIAEAGINVTNGLETHWNSVEVKVYQGAWSEKEALTKAKKLRDHILNTLRGVHNV